MFLSTKLRVSSSELVFTIDTLLFPTLHTPRRVQECYLLSRKDMNYLMFLQLLFNSFVGRANVVSCVHLLLRLFQPYGHFV